MLAKPVLSRRRNGADMFTGASCAPVLLRHEIMKNDVITSGRARVFASLVNAEQRLNEDARITYAVQFHTDIALLAHSMRAVVPENAASACFCESCGSPIPEARRMAIKGVRLCVACKTAEEKEERRYA